MLNILVKFVFGLLIQQTHNQYLQNIAQHTRVSRALWYIMYSMTYFFLIKKVQSNEGKMKIPNYVNIRHPCSNLIEAHNIKYSYSNSML